MTKARCGLCGKDPATGFAGVDKWRFCHGDDDPDPTCFMQVQALSKPSLDELLERLER